jgi:Tol biopolymer transport system component
VPRPLREFLEIRSAAPSNFSADGSRVLISSNLSGTSQLYRVARDGGELEQLTDFDEPVGGAYLPVGGDIVVTRDEGGNERHQLWLMADAPAAELRPLVHEPEFIHRVGGVTRDGSLLAYASNVRNGVDFDVYVVPLAASDSAEGEPESQPEPRLVFDMGGWCQPVGFSPDGRSLGVVRLTERNGDNDLYLVDVSTKEVVHVSPHDDESSYGSPSWLPDSSAFFFATDQGRDRAAIARYDTASGSWAYVVERDWECSCTIDWPGTRLLVGVVGRGAVAGPGRGRLRVLPRRALPRLLVLVVHRARRRVAVRLRHGRHAAAHLVAQGGAQRGVG